MALCDRPCCGGVDPLAAEKVRKAHEARKGFEAWLEDPANADTIARIKREFHENQKQEVRDAVPS